MSAEKTGYPDESKTQNPGYPPYPTNPQPAGYSPPQTQGGYPQPQDGYPPQPQGGYPQTQGGYPPQQPGGAPPPYNQLPAGVQVGMVPIQQAPNQTVIIRQNQIQPQDYLAFAIFVTICCCLPFGIVGIIKASEVRSRFISGDYQGAEESSRSAKKWSWAGFLTGIIIMGGIFVFYVLLYLVILGGIYTSY